MKLTDPIKNFKCALYPLGDVTQWFGENPKLYKSAIGIDGHNGIDIVAPWGTPVLAIEDGIIADVKNDPGGYGMHIRLFSKGIEREWTYGHLCAIMVNVGDSVRSGDILGAMGNTGFVVSGDTPYWGTNPSKGTSHPGTHLHFGLRLIKKDRKGWTYKNSKTRISVLDYENGFKGAVDPLPYMFDMKLKSSQIIVSSVNKKSNVLFELGMFLRKLKM